jgi:hypothetical protein
MKAHALAQITPHLGATSWLRAALRLGGLGVRLTLPGLTLPGLTLPGLTLPGLTLPGHRVLNIGVVNTGAVTLGAVNLNAVNLGMRNADALNLGTLGYRVHGLGTLRAPGLWCPPPCLWLRVVARHVPTPCTAAPVEHRVPALSACGAARGAH